MLEIIYKNKYYIIGFVVLITLLILSNLPDDEIDVITNPTVEVKEIEEYIYVDIKGEKYLAVSLFFMVEGKPIMQTHNRLSSSPFH